MCFLQETHVQVYIIIMWLISILKIWVGNLAKQHMFCLRSGGATSHCLIMDCSLDTSSWETIQKHTLILTGPRDVLYHREAFLQPLTDIIGMVLLFGPLGKPWEWWLTLKTESESVLSFGPLGKPWEWWLTLKTESESVLSFGPLGKPWEWWQTLKTENESVLSFGPLGKPWEWWLTLKTES